MSSEDRMNPQTQYFRCEFEGCSRVFKRRERLETHTRVHTGERPFSCHIEGCSKAYARSQHLTRHIENAHKLKDPVGDQFSCPVCKKELANIYCLEKHVKAEHEDPHGPKRYACPEPGCDQDFHKKKQLVSHRLAEHTGHLLEARKCHRCPHEGCGKVFTWLNLLKRHMKVHQGYTCDTEGCDRVFPNWSSLRKHKAHDHAPVYSCEECGIKFSRKPNLTQHIKRKHQELSQTFTCPVEGCERVYRYKSNLNLHIRESHEGEDIWRNRKRARPVKKKEKKPRKKISFAAKLCGLDDREGVLKPAKPRGRRTAETVGISNSLSRDGAEDISLDKSDKTPSALGIENTVEERPDTEAMEETSQGDRECLDTSGSPPVPGERNESQTSCEMEAQTSASLVRHDDEPMVFDFIAGEQVDDQRTRPGLAKDLEFTELTVIIKHDDRIEKTTVAIRTETGTQAAFFD